MAESSPSTHKAEVAVRGLAYEGLIQTIKSCQTNHDSGSGSHRHTSAQSTHKHQQQLTRQILKRSKHCIFQKFCEPVFYRKSSYSFTSQTADNFLIQWFIKMYSNMYSLRSRNSRYFSQATTSTTWPFPLCRLIMKGISSVGLGATKQLSKPHNRRLVTSIRF